MSNQQIPDAARAAADPTTSAEQLRLIAYYNPELRAQVAVHPNVYPGLLEWLKNLGDPQVEAALAASESSAEPIRDDAAGLGADAEHQAAVSSQIPEADEGAPEAEETPGVDAAPGIAKTSQAEDSAATGEATDIHETSASPQAEETTVLEQEDFSPAAGGFAAGGTAVLPTVETSAGAGGAGEQPIVERASVFPTPATAPSEPGDSVFAWSPTTPAQPSPASAQAVPGQAVPAQVQPMGWTPASPAATPPVSAPVPEDEDGSKKGGTWLAGLLGALLALVLLLLVAVVFVVTNGFGTQQATSPSTGSQTAQPSTPTAPEAAQSQGSDVDEDEVKYPAPASAVTMAQFVAPSGNIACLLDDDRVLCQIYETNWAGTDYEVCGGAEGGVLIATADGAQNSCAQGDAGEITSVLDYGRYAVNGHSACTATEDGISCWNTVSGDSFALSRSGWMVADKGEITPGQFSWR